MIQDRVGPNRSVIWLPTPVAQGGAVAPALLAVGLVALSAAGYKVGIGTEPQGADRASAAMTYSQLGIFFTWVTFAIIAGLARGRGARSKVDLWLKAYSPRSIVYLGFGAHLARADRLARDRWHRARRDGDGRWLRRRRRPAHVFDPVRRGLRGVLDSQRAAVRPAPARPAARVRRRRLEDALERGLHPAERRSFPA